MEIRNRFAVPAEDLEAVRVDHALQVQEQAAPRAPQSWDWGSLPSAPGAGWADADGE